MPLFPQIFPAVLHTLEHALGYDFTFRVNPTTVSHHLDLGKPGPWF